MVRRLASPDLATLVLAAITAGCSVVFQGRTVATLPGREGVHEVPVGLDDPDGLVATVEVAEADASVTEPARAKVEQQSVVLAWLGGACDSRAVVKVTGNRETIFIVSRTDEAIGLGCVALGVPRAVAITFREPIGDRAIVLNR